MSHNKAKPEHALKLHDRGCDLTYGLHLYYKDGAYYREDKCRQISVPKSFFKDVPIGRLFYFVIDDSETASYYAAKDADGHVHLFQNKPTLVNHLGYEEVIKWSERYNCTYTDYQFPDESEYIDTITHNKIDFMYGEIIFVLDASIKDVLNHSTEKCCGIKIQYI